MRFIGQITTERIVKDDEKVEGTNFRAEKVEHTRIFAEDFAA